MMKSLYPSTIDFQSDSLIITTFTINQVSPDSQCTISIEYPQISGMKDSLSSQKINEYLKDVFTNIPEFYEIENCDSTNALIYEVSYTTSLNSDGFISLIFNYYEYSGGAHGNYSSFGININTHTGNLISLEEVIDEKYFPDLALLIEKKLKDKYNVNNLTDAGFFEDKITIDLERNFYFTPHSMVIGFDPYEIAPYSMGMIEVELLFSEIERFLEASFRFIHN
jgi:hypothetical protein